MYLTIYIQKEVPDSATGQVLLDFVADKLKDQPGVKVSASVSETLQLPVIPE